MNSTDAEKLAGLWAKAQPSVTGLIRALVADREQTEELVQRTAVKCVEKFGVFDPSLSFTPWAIGIARLEVFAWRRSRAKQPQLLDDALLEQLAISYERILEREGPLQEALEQCLGAADARDRQALDLYYGHSMNTTEVGQQMELSGVAVRVLLHRARASLRECIERRLRSEGESK